MLRAGDRLPPAPWMTAPETRAVIAALTAGGAEVRFVGGCVRDAVLGRPAKDIDFATHEPPATVIERLDAADIRAIPTGVEHGTVTAVVGDRHFEITTLRVDVETFGRHARVAYTDDWVEDAARRDLTINALSCSVDGTLHDPFGGLEDLALGRIRFVGEPAARIAEDRLRLLRYFRFYAHYGKAPPDETALAACAAAATDLADLSGERVAGEMLRLLAAPDPAPTLRLMAERGVLAHALPARADIPRLAALVAVEQTALGADALRRLGALQANGAEGAERIADRLKLSNAERERLLRLAGVPADLTPDLDGPARRRLLYRLGSDAFRDAVALAWAEAVRDGKATPTAEDWRVLLRDAESWSQPKLPVKGRDLVALGVAPGPEVGRLLAEIEVWWVAGGFRADRAACLAYARSLFKAT